MRRMSREEYRKLLVSILKRIDSICRNNNLTYYLYAGSLLGAVRHGGFIPWDDDLDIAMPRDDYNKLAEIINTDSDDLCFISYNYNDDTIYPFGKVCDTSTCMIEKNFRPVLNYGAFVDVFPLDFVSNNPLLRNLECFYYSTFNRIIAHSSRIGFDKSGSFFRDSARTVSYYLCRHMNTFKLISVFDRQLRSMHKQETDYIGLPWFVVYPSRFFSDTCDVTFEGLNVMAPKDYDGVLAYAYGDYMTLPPVEQRQPKHSLDCYVLEKGDLS